ncbi:hypothetical protein [Listeria ivanovii]|uniref:Uncharacterized protein n=2 Tax=Listeria ivanovii TaxID=1638 RepID=A0ABS1G2K4_LISIV|nr:hypothetical protein [Listeria ivanovii]AIS61081.1 hypothetical protein JL58_14365 [Listeria ivanovii subsp. londoniensis]AIS63899.1 hypothetical protein JL53_14795 [Listeria ivanovii subsp. londoniensis]MBC2256408.1 hypothetical protein [Listeria ivanovii]MBK1961069.1 hypothetical protein [Listeria ivanovii subsp. londoniensis]MBK1966313.1 hypothetical protein [Listeria ivanovii subsp. londoniensis]
MKRWLVGIITILFLISGILMSPVIGQAQEKVDYEALYNQGVSEGIIKQADVSLAAWTDENKNQYEQVYQDGLKDGVYDNSMSYEEWIKFNNYGQPPVVEEEWEEVPQKPMVRGVYKGYTVKKGDILITNGTSSSGLLGHAAIANGNEYILDIPGKGETTRQQSTAKWMKEYDGKGWVKVYRLKDSSVANAAASWADKNYYSTNGTSKQNIFPKYGMTGSRYSKNPTYCSKIVLQAYYFGTGSKPVVHVFPSLVAVYDLPNYFSKSYKPQQVKYFK